MLKITVRVDEKGILHHTNLVVKDEDVEYPLSDIEPGFYLATFELESLTKEDIEDANPEG